MAGVLVFWDDGAHVVEHEWSAIHVSDDRAALRLLARVQVVSAATDCLGEAMRDRYDADLFTFEYRGFVVFYAVRGLGIPPAQYVVVLSCGVKAGRQFQRVENAARRRLSTL